MLDGRATSRALRWAHRARRVRHFHDEDLIDALYKSYLTVIGVGVAIFYLAPLLGEQNASADLVHQIALHGAAALGVGIALVAALGLRSGSRGGPLALEHADVLLVLLAPVPRSTTLRSAALRQARGVLFMGAVIGAVLGCLASMRLPGELWEWVPAAGAFAILAALVAWGAALIGSGLRIGRPVANVVGVLLLAWAAVDVALDTTTSPMALVGKVGIAPIDWSPLAILGAVLALAVPAVGLAVIGGASIEAAQRRSGLVGQLRFAATMRDVRTTMVLHRQLSDEQPRRHPWWRVRPRAAGRATWYRDWQGLARWPGTRFVRAIVLGVVVGLALGAVWDGALALVLVAGAAIFFVALDAAEGLGQETDHLELPSSYPREFGDLALLHLIVPAVWCALVLVVSTGVVYAFTGSVTALETAAVVLLPAAVAAAIGAGVSLVLGVPKPETELAFASLPELGPMILILGQVLPPAIAVVAFIPLALDHSIGVGDWAGGFFFGIAAVVIAAGTFVRVRKVGLG